MSITEELRNLAVYLDSAAAGKSEHGFSPVALRLNRIADQIDEALESYYIQLPKDADGETIHLQDRMSWDNGTFNVHELKLTAAGWTTWDELHGYTVHADECRHVQPDSWMRIVYDALLADRDVEYVVSQSKVDELVERCKRLAGEDA